MRFSIKPFLLSLIVCFAAAFACERPAPAAPKKAEPDAALAPQVSDAVVRIDSSSSFSGTGVVVTPEGHVVTNVRTVMGYPYSTYTVGKDRVKAKVIAIDQKHDLAVLKAETPLPRWATLDAITGPAKDEPARLFSYAYRGSDPPMIEFKSATYKVDDPHFKGESAGTMDLADLLIVRPVGGTELRADGCPVFSSKTGRLIGISIGKMDGGANSLIAMPATVVRALLVANKIDVPAVQ